MDCCCCCQPAAAALPPQHISGPASSSSKAAAIHHASLQAMKYTGLRCVPANRGCKQVPVKVCGVAPWPHSGRSLPYARTAWPHVLAMMQHNDSSCYRAAPSCSCVVHLLSCCSCCPAHLCCNGHEAVGRLKGVGEALVGCWRVGVPLWVDGQGPWPLPHLIQQLLNQGHLAAPPAATPAASNKRQLPLHKWSEPCQPQAVGMGALRMSLWLHDAAGSRACSLQQY